MNWWELTVGALVGLLLAEWLEVCPWLAARIIPPAVHLWTADEAQREVYAEEWQALIDERPGKLLKLVSALVLLGGGVLRAGGSGLRRGFAVIGRVVWSDRTETILARFFVTCAVASVCTSIFKLASGIAHDPGDQAVEVGQMIFAGSMASTLIRQFLRRRRESPNEPPR
ncbi:hypothetical protein ACFPIJ_23580 [Dactylosporangium cerinum]|uniref:Integral membrane protein n=1 Tax=Dactylosporangium cerinum TaxID=1434730 RepID=A0ABV9VWW1_9ACTN